MPAHLPPSLSSCFFLRVRGPRGVGICAAKRKLTSTLRSAPWVRACRGPWPVNKNNGDWEKTKLYYSGFYLRGAHPWRFSSIRVDRRLLPEYRIFSPPFCVLYVCYRRLPAASLTFSGEGNATQAKMDDTGNATVTFFGNRSVGSKAAARAATYTSTPCCASCAWVWNTDRAITQRIRVLMYLRTYTRTHGLIGP